MQRKHRNGISPLIECPPFRENYSSLWSNLKTKTINFNQADGITMSDFITNLDPHKKSFIIAGRPHHNLFNILDIFTRQIKIN